ncbi:MAG: helix-turn-helix domain-containing protein [Acetobacteraceae bacterium]|nr:helix-turn-helix domain-containing protein [Acetobacteraceae bacterium]
METAELVRQKMKELRLTLGMTQEEFGRLVGVSGQHIYRVESGDRSPTLEMIDALSKKCGVPRAYFFTAEDRRSLPPSEIQAFLRSTGELTEDDIRLILDLLELRRRRREQEREGGDKEGGA